MDLKVAFLLCCVFATSIAQDYSCGTTNNCSENPEFSRGEVIGCLYFCNLDDDGDSQLTRTEFNGAFVTCAGSLDGTCELSVFLPLMTQILPICDAEAVGIYDDWSGRDGQPGLTQADVALLWDAAAEDGADVVLPAGFKALWDEMWPNVEEATCDKPYP